VYASYQDTVTGGGSGGTVEFIPTANGGYEKVHTFTYNGSGDQTSYTLSFVNTPNVHAEVLVVAGGGAGGAATNAHSASGGGAGGLIYKSVLLNQTSYNNITVGRGGKGNTTPYNSTAGAGNRYSENGKISKFDTLEADGGGGADHSKGNANRGANGGSGGGNGNSQNTPGQPAAGQGNSGGRGGSLFSGGGGGAGREGYDPPAIKRTGRGGSGGGTGICNGDFDTVIKNNVTYNSTDASPGFDGGSGIVIVRFPIVFPKPTLPED
jgi:hypothetical protein